MHVQRMSKFLVLAVVVSTVPFVVKSRASAGTTVISMPPPPKVTNPQPASNVEDTDAPAVAKTWLDRAKEADVAGHQRSFLGIVAISRYAKTRYSPRYFYYWRSRYGSWNSYYGSNYYPFDVSFLNGWPIWSVSFPWTGSHHAHHSHGHSHHAPMDK